MKYLPVLVLFVLCGCAPWPTTSQPEVDLAVMDEAGNPIKEATVKFANYKIAMRPEVEINVLNSNESGQVYLNKKGYTQMVILAADGGHSYDWSYCIEKKGYLPVAKNHLKEAYFANGTVFEKLISTNQRMACQWQEYPHGFNIVAIKP